MKGPVDYTLGPGRRHAGATEATALNTMAAPSFMCGSALCMVKKAPRVFVAKISSKSTSPTVATGVILPIPERVNGTSRTLALFYIDLDGFEEVNDRYGERPLRGAATQPSPSHDRIVSPCLTLRVPEKRASARRYSTCM